MNGLYFKARMTAETWHIYYQHWAKEANRVKKKIFLNTQLKKTIKKIYCWSACIIEESCPDKLEYLQRRLLETELHFIFSYLPDDIKGKFLMMEDLASLLCPSHTPKDWDLWNNSFFMLDYEEEVFLENRALDRVAKNLRINDRSKLWNRNYEQLRSLDSILILF